MLFSKIFSIAATTFAAVAAAQAQIASGRYRIHSGTTTARSFPSGGQQGPFQVAITMSDEFASVWELWDITSDGPDTYTIQSVGTGAKAYAPSQTLGQQVFAASNQQTSWLIENKGVEDSNGNPLFSIKIPFQDFLWTIQPTEGEIITLQASSGSPTSQRFFFQPA